MNRKSDAWKVEPSNGIASNPSGPEPDRDFPSAPRLRLATPDDDSYPLDSEPSCRGSDNENLSPRMTLREFYASFFLPVCLVALGRSRRTLDQYEQSLGLWGRFTLDPPLLAIDQRLIAKFTGGLRALPGIDTPTLGDNSIHKHCRTVQAIMDRAGPWARKINEFGQDLLDRVPLIPKPSLFEPDVEDNFTIAELTVLLAHCAVPVAPSELGGRDREIWWRSLFLFAYNAGLRIGSLMTLEWTWLKIDARGSRIEIPSRSGTKGGRPKRFPLNQFALSALEMMRPISGGPQGGRVWPWRGWPKSEGWLHEQRRRILDAAKFPEDRRFGFHGCRKAMCTELAEIDITAAMLGAGHKDMKTTTTRYVNKRSLAKASARLPQPDQPPQPGQQRLLF
jgi:Phage integrase family